MHISIIGGGPAGLRAAEVAAMGGADVTLYEAKPSVGRKFLVAGRGGLNLTHGEPLERFESRYAGPGRPDGIWESLLSDFSPEAMRQWAGGLGIETFQATSGRVYPREMKAAPLLRRWVRRLRDLGVVFAMRHRWTGLRPGDRMTLDFQTPGGPRSQSTDAVILALGGASWPQTGSDGSWISVLEHLGITISPLLPANCGWEIPWPEELLAKAEGKPLKNIAAGAGGEDVAGELLVTRYGLEGGAIYQLGKALRSMREPVIRIDFKPTFTAGRLVAKMEGVKRNLFGEAVRRWRLSEACAAILTYLQGDAAWESAAQLAAAVKCCQIALAGPRPIAEAISSAGGVRWSELDDRLMLRKLPGVYVAGEMIDWEAPTGGYLMQGCFATGTRAASSALARFRERS
jgi:uncharacterized flavoprotein (TIGR03862 family)